MGQGKSKHDVKNTSVTVTAPPTTRWDNLRRYINTVNSFKGNSELKQELFCYRPVPKTSKQKVEELLSLVPKEVSISAFDRTNIKKSLKDLKEVDDDSLKQIITRNITSLSPEHLDLVKTTLASHQLDPNLYKPSHCVVKALASYFNLPKGENYLGDPFQSIFDPVIEPLFYPGERPTTDTYSAQGQQEFIFKPKVDNNLNSGKITITEDRPTESYYTIQQHLNGDGIDVNIDLKKAVEKGEEYFKEHNNDKSRYPLAFVILGGGNEHVMMVIGTPRDSQDADILLAGLLQNYIQSSQSYKQKENQLNIQRAKLKRYNPDDEDVDGAAETEAPTQLSDQVAKLEGEVRVLNDQIKDILNHDFFKVEGFQDRQSILKGVNPSESPYFAFILETLVDKFKSNQELIKMYLLLNNLADSDRNINIFTDELDQFKNLADYYKLIFANNADEYYQTGKIPVKGNKIQNLVFKILNELCYRFIQTKKVWSLGFGFKQGTANPLFGRWLPQHNISKYDGLIVTADDTLPDLGGRKTKSEIVWVTRFDKDMLNSLIRQLKLVKQVDYTVNKEYDDRSPLDFVSNVCELHSSVYYLAISQITKDFLSAADYTNCVQFINTLLSSNFKELPGSKNKLDCGLFGQPKNCKSLTPSMFRDLYNANFSDKSLSDIQKYLLNETPLSDKDIWKFTAGDDAKKEKLRDYAKKEKLLEKIRENQEFVINTEDGEVKISEDLIREIQQTQ